MLKEFKAYLLRGNVLDLVVAVILGGAFGAIIDSLVKDVLMPPLGLALKRVNFSDLFVSLDGKSYPSLKAAKDAAAPTINYGLFLQATISFIIVAFVIFLVMRAAARYRHPKEAAPAPAMKDCPYCLSSIPLKATRCPHCTSELKAA